MRKLIKSISLISILLMMSHLSLASDQEISMKSELKQSIQTDKELLATIKYIEELRDKAIVHRRNTLKGLSLAALIAFVPTIKLVYAEPVKRVTKVLRILGLYALTLAVIEGRVYYMNLGDDLELLNNRLAEKKEELQKRLDDNQYYLACIE